MILNSLIDTFDQFWLDWIEPKRIFFGWSYARAPNGWKDPPKKKVETNVIDI